MWKCMKIPNGKNQRQTTKILQHSPKVECTHEAWLRSWCSCHHRPWPPRKGKLSRWRNRKEMVLKKQQKSTSVQEKDVKKDSREWGRFYYDSCVKDESVKGEREQQQYEDFAEYNYILHVTSLIHQKQGGVAGQAWLSKNDDTTKTHCATCSTSCCTETLQSTILLMEEILHHLGCMTPCK